MSLNINMLPYEVLEGVFYYLEDCQRLEASLVCRKWISVLDSNELLKGICLLVNKDNYTHLAALSTPTRRFGHFEFKSVTLDINFLEIMRSNYHFIHTLSFVDCSYKKDDFGADKVLPLDRLKSLNIMESCNVLDLFTSLPNVEELFINDYYYIKDCLIKKVQDITSKLKKIHLVSVRISKNKKAYKRCFANKKVLNSLSAKILSFPFIESFIYQHSTTLENLLIGGLPHSFLSTIATIPNLKLKEFKFTLHTEPSAVVEFCRLQPSLASIEVISVSFDKSHWAEIVQRLPQLQCISLLYSNMPDLNLLLGLNHLKQLSVTNCRIVEDVAITIPSTSLKKLDCSQNCTFLLKLLPCVRCIQELTLHSNVTDEVMWVISSNLTNLKVLHIFESDLTDSGLTGRILPGRKSTSLPIPISNLKGLTKLSFISLPKITEKCVGETIQFPFLTYFRLWNCRKITENIRPAVFERNPCLRKCEIRSTTKENNYMLLSVHFAKKH